MNLSRPIFNKMQSCLKPFDAFTVKLVKICVSKFAFFTYRPMHTNNRFFAEAFGSLARCFGHKIAHHSLTQTRYASLYSLLTESFPFRNRFGSCPFKTAQKCKEEKTRDEKGWHLQSYIAVSTSSAICGCVCVFSDMVASILQCGAGCCAAAASQCQWKRRNSGLAWTNRAVRLNKPTAIL